MGVVGAGTWGVGLLDFGVLLRVGERNVSSSIGFVDVVVAGAGVQMRVGNRKVSAHVRANPVRDVLLPHGVLVGFVFAGAGAVQIARLRIVLHAEGELR